MTGIFRLYYIILYPIFHLLFRIRVLHKERIPDGAMLVCANHTSLSDPILLCFALGYRRHTRFMAKAELFRIPVLGALLRAIGTFGVVRGGSDINAVKTAMRILKEGGILGIFPEGKRVDADEQASAKTGAIMLASKTAAPILPVYVPRRKKLFRRLEMVIGEPYHIERTRGGAEAYGPLAQELMDRIAALGEESGQ